MKKVATLFSAITLLISVFFSSLSFGQMKMENRRVITTKETELKTNMRKLWEDHIIWTRNVIFCLVDDLPGKNQAITRLLQNQADIGNAVKPY